MCVRSIMQNVLCLFLIYVYAGVCFADRVVLKNGNIIEGKIVERTEGFTRLDKGGFSFTYFFEDIEEVIEEKNPQPEIQTEDSAAVEEIKQENLALKEYFDQQQRFSLLRPMLWKPIDLETAEQKAKDLLSTELIAFIEGVEIYNYGYIAVGYRNRINRKASYGEAMAELTLASGGDIIDGPSLDYVSNERVIRFVARKIISEQAFAVTNIVFFEGKRFFIFEIATKEADYYKLKETLDKSCRSINILR